jgi:amidophosphoribosyltransferase
VTPVGAGYFERLEKIRGENQKAKVRKEAREAVASGDADDSQLRIARNGVEVAENGELVPADEINGNGVHGEFGQRGAADDGFSDGDDGVNTGREITDRMDISLHNFGDYGGATRE